MKTRLANIWEVLRDSYWFIPSLMVLASIASAVALLVIDRRLDITVLKIGSISLVYSGDIAGARDLLSAIAASIIAIAGVSFSITVVALSLAANQYGPRLLRHYMRNTGNQVVLGTFVSTFTFCLLVYAQIPDEGIWKNPPRICVTFAIIQALACIGVFIYFIHHMSEFIRADTIIHAAFHELLHRVDHLYPEKLGLDEQQIAEQTPTEPAPPDFQSNAKTLAAAANGYLQAIETEMLMQIASEKDLLIHLTCRPGDFLIRDLPIARVYPADRLDDQAQQHLSAAFILGIQRTPEQDIEFAIHELVEIALRALSPSLNDPFTAMSCLDRLTAGFCMLTERRIPSSNRYDQAHKLRLVLPVWSFDELVGAAFDPIRRNALENELVKQHLSSCLHTLIDHARSEDHRRPLLTQFALLRRDD